MLAKMPTGTPGVKMIARMLPLRISPSIGAFTGRLRSASTAKEVAAAAIPAATTSASVVAGSSEAPGRWPPRIAPPIGEATERDRGEERHERKRRGDEADGARPGAEREQPVGCF